jgi:hypothetical protein
MDDSTDAIEQFPIAFGMGADARLKGFFLSSNPFDSAVSWSEWLAFRRGWEHVDLSWGEDSRWPCRRLPEVINH